MARLAALVICLLTASASNCFPTLFEQTITEKGYPCERHSVKTEDNFVLTLFRVQAAGSMEAGKLARGKPVVILAHGLDEISDIWILNRGEKALGLLLANLGFDVWLLNSRGSAYSRQHAEFEVHQEELWDFSFQEMAEFDVPAMLRYVARQTGEKRMAAIGHSQGSTIFIAAMSDPKTSQEVQAHLSCFIGLSPATHISDVPVKTQRIYDAISYYVSVRGLLGVNYPYFSAPSLNLFKHAIFFTCTHLAFVCESIMSVPGLSPENNDASLLRHLLVALPGGTSFRSYLHFVQLSRIESQAPVLRRFDFGLEENLRRYKQQTPPDYDFSLINTPLYIHGGAQDNLVSPESTQRFADHLRSMGKKVYSTVHDKWDHFSVILSGSPEAVFATVVAHLNETLIADRK